MRTLSISVIASFFSVWLVAGAAFAHPPGVEDEGTPDPQARRPELERGTEFAPPPRSGWTSGDGPASSPAVRRPPLTLPYYDFAPIPWGYRLKMGSGKKILLVIGVSTFALAHVVAVASSVGLALGCDDKCGSNAAALVVPVAGPMIAFGDHSSHEPNALYATLGAFQIAGFGMILAGATLNDKRLVREDKSFPLTSPLSFTPTLGPGQFGLGIRGKF